MNETVEGGGFCVHVHREPNAGEVTYETVAQAGWHFGVVLTGRISTEQPGYGEGKWSEGEFIHFWSDTPIDTFHRVFAGPILSSIFLQVQADVAEQLLGDDYAAVTSPETRQNPVYVSGAASPRMVRIAQQMLTTQRQTTERRLYLSGRAHDLIASLVAMETTSVKKRVSGIERLSGRDFEQISHAADLLLDRLAEPPTCAELARMVGVSSKRLVAGFNAVFGMSPAAFTREQRLERARSQLEEGAASVSTVAYGLGYNPAHFATEFKRRFGLSPSDLYRN